jgi:predicted methyltransferase
MTGYGARLQMIYDGKAILLSSWSLAKLERRGLICVQCNCVKLTDKGREELRREQISASCWL